MRATEKSHRREPATEESHRGAELSGAEGPKRQFLGLGKNPLCSLWVTYLGNKERVVRTFPNYRK